MTLAQTPPAPLTVVFIASSGRSGSTILDRILGSAPGACSCGELQRFWDVLYLPDRLCGCGAKLLECPFWTSVIAAFGPITPGDAGRFARLHEMVTRTRSLPLHWTPVRPAALRAAVSEYQGVVLRLLQAIAGVSARSTLIDSSKGAGYGWLLSSLPGIRLKVINLVRDSRAVANSWLNHHRLQTRRPFYPWNATYAALGWDVEHAIAELMRRRAHAYVRVRYEDFARRPGAVLSELAGKLGIAVPDVSPEGEVLQAEAHMIAGNRTRFLKGPLKIEEDQRWKSELSALDAAKVTALTWPLLLRHGYPVTYARGGLPSRSSMAAG